MGLPDVEYRLIAGRVLPKEAGPVIEIQASEHEGEHYGPGVMFWCPCGERRVVIRMPPHKSITFDSERRPTIKDSIGAKPAPPEFPTANWCHAFMTDGKFTLTSDATCPGAIT